MTTLKRSIEAEDRRTKIEAEIIATGLLARGIGAVELSEALGRDKYHVTHALKALVEEGQLLQERHGSRTVYRERGENWLTKSWRTITNHELGYKPERLGAL